MKWALLAVMIGGIPLLANWLNQNPRYARFVWGLLGFSPFYFLVSAPVAWPLWPGYVKGIEVTTLDALAMAILLCRGPRRYSLPFKPAIALYMIAVAITIPAAPTPFAASFYLWQLLRVFLVYAAIARVAASDDGTKAVIIGIVLGLTYQAVNAILARAEGAIQTGGTLGHQNLLGFMSHMAILPAFALLLSGRQTKVAILGLVSGMTVVILTASRATIGLAAAGFVLTFLLSATMRWSSRKAGMALAAVAVLAVGYPLANASLERRYEAQRPYQSGDSDYDEREAFEDAARMMIADYPFGVGANSYVNVANVEGYSSRAGVIWASGSRSANVHNSYLLITAETGYLGGLTFAFLLFGAIFAALRGAWRWRRNRNSELLVGLGAALITISLHALYEWIFVTYQAQYLFAITLGLIAGVREQMRRSEQPQLQRTVSPPLTGFGALAASSSSAETPPLQMSSAGLPERVDGSQARPL